MDFSNLSLVSLMRSKMSYLSARQEVLAQNIANADTPGYSAMDIAQPDFSNMVAASGKLKMAAASGGKSMAPSGGLGGPFKVGKRDTTDELNPNGNNIAIEEEMAKAGMNQAEYQKVVNMYGKMITMFKTALGNASTGS